MDSRSPTPKGLYSGFHMEKEGAEPAQRLGVHCADVLTRPTAARSTPQPTIPIHLIQEGLAELGFLGTPHSVNHLPHACAWASKFRVQQSTIQRTLEILRNFFFATNHSFIHSFNKPVPTLCPILWVSSLKPHSLSLDMQVLVRKSGTGLEIPHF